MPDSKISDKYQRQYKAVKDKLRDAGTSLDKAKEIAARTVNKARRQAGLTENKTTKGTGNPNTELEERTVEELRNRARELEISGRSTMRKAELVEAIRRQNA